MALHMRLHEMNADLVERLDSSSLTPAQLADVLDEVAGRTLQHRKLFLLHVVNRASFEVLHARDHAEEHRDLEQRFQEFLGDADLPLGERVRMACAIGSLMGFMMLGSRPFASVPTGELTAALREAIHDLLGLTRR